MFSSSVIHKINSFYFSLISPLMDLFSMEKNELVCLSVVAIKLR